MLVLGDISAYIYVLQIGGWAWGNHRLCTRFEPNSWLLLMKASSRWSGVTSGDANYWCLCPSGKERGLTDLKCSFLLHFGAQSLFFKNAKQCFCITGKLHVSIWKAIQNNMLNLLKRPREKRVTEAVSLEFTSLVSPVMYFLAYAIVKNRNHKWNKILTWLKINKTSFVCSQSDRFKRCARSM